MNEHDVRKYFINQFKDAPKNVIEQLGESIFGNNLNVVFYNKPLNKAITLKKFNATFDIVERDKYVNRYILKYLFKIEDTDSEVDYDELLKKVNEIEKDTLAWLEEARNFKMPVTKD